MYMVLYKKNYMNQENELYLILRVKKCNKKNLSMLTQINIYWCDWLISLTPHLKLTRSFDSKTDQKTYSTELLFFQSLKNFFFSRVK